MMSKYAFGVDVGGTTVKEISEKAFIGCTGIKEIMLSRRFEENYKEILKDVDLLQVTIHWI